MGTDEPVNGGGKNRVIPSVYGEASPYHRLTAFLVFPSALVAAGLAVGFMSDGVYAKRAYNAAFHLGCAYAFGSNAWLFRYGPKMYNTCIKVEYLGKQAFSTIQAALFPEYFALQIAATIVALGAHTGGGTSSFSSDPVSWCLLTAILFGLVNIMVLGPLTSKYMIEMYSLCPEGFYGEGQSCSAPLIPNEQEKKQLKMRFGIVHGISMLANLGSLGMVMVGIVVAA